MRFIYPAVIRKKEDGTYHGELPDLEGCYGDGDSMDECIRSCNQAAYDWIDLEMHEEDPDLPAASEKEDLQKQYKDDNDVEVRNILTIYRILEGWEE